MRKILILFVLIATSLLTACSLQEETITIGFAATLTGKYASVGTMELYGAQLAVKEINDAGGIDGKQVILEVRDDEADPEKAVEIDNQFIEDGVQLIIGHALSIVAIETTENAEDKEILFLSPSIGTDSLSNMDDNFLRNIPTTKYEGEAIAEALLETNPEKILMLYNMDNYVLTQYHEAAFIEVLENNGYTTDDYDTVGFYSSNQEDLNNMESLISSGVYDSIMFAGSNVDAAPVVNYIIANDIDIDIHLSSWAATGLIERIDTQNNDFVHVYFSYKEKTESQGFLDFQQDFMDIYAEEVSMLAVNTYDLVYVLKEAIEHANSTNYLDVKAAILEIEIFEGISGDFTINEYGDCFRTHYQMKIVNGEYVIEE